MDIDIKSRLAMLESRVMELEKQLAESVVKQTGEEPTKILDQWNTTVHRRYQNAMYVDAIRPNESA